MDVKAAEPASAEVIDFFDYASPEPRTSPRRSCIQRPEELHSAPTRGHSIRDGDHWRLARTRTSYRGWTGPVRSPFRPAHWWAAALDRL